jgi:hypothetical protein
MLIAGSWGSAGRIFHNFKVARFFGQKRVADHLRAHLFEYIFRREMKKAGSRIEASVHVKNRKFFTGSL